MYFASLYSSDLPPGATFMQCAGCEVAWLNDPLCWVCSFPGQEATPPRKLGGLTPPRTSTFYSEDTGPRLLFLP